VTGGPVASGADEYNYDMIFDADQNGVYHMYCSGATNSADWFEVAAYGGGRPVWIEEQQGGFEGDTEYAPYQLGRQEVAAADGWEGWTPWEGDYWENNPGVCIGPNPESGAAGNIDWNPGHNQCG
jgi:hypothetical protein